MSLNTCGPSLLSGNIFCGDCGGRITVTSSSSFHTTTDGVKHRYCRHKYVCGNHLNRRKSCNGQYTYDMGKIDDAVENLLVKLLSNITNSPQNEAVTRDFEARILALKDTLKFAKQELLTLTEKENKLTLEIANCIIGDSKFTEEQLQQALQAVAAKKTESEKTVANAESRLSNLSAEKERSKNGCEQLCAWSEEFKTAKPERRKMIAAEVFDRVELYKGNKIKIVMNAVYKPFFDGEEIEMVPQAESDRDSESA